MRSLISFFLVLLSFGGAANNLSAGEGNFESIANAFIATIAKDHPDLKADITIWQKGAPVPAGHQAGHSTALGDYTFRPKYWSELSDTKKVEVKRHPAFKAFIVSIRNERIYPAVSAASPENPTPGWFPVEGSKPQASEYRVKVTADEMIKNRPSVVPVQLVPVAPSAK